MKQYVMMQSPDGQYPLREISLIEHGIDAELFRANDLLRDGWKRKGTIITDMTREELKAGIGFYTARTAKLFKTRCRELEEELADARTEIAELKKEIGLIRKGKEEITE